LRGWPIETNSVVVIGAARALTPEEEMLWQRKAQNQTSSKTKLRKDKLLPEVLNRE
jgi:hypothetical protein